MRVPILLPLQPDTNQYPALNQVIRTVNAATDMISQFAWENQLYHPRELHQLLYRKIREGYGLSAQHVVLSFTRVAEAYKSKCQYDSPISFSQMRAIPYDSRMIRVQEDYLSILANNKRICVKYSTKASNRNLMDAIQGKGWLFEEDSTYYIYFNANIDLLVSRSRMVKKLLSFFR